MGGGASFTITLVTWHDPPLPKRVPEELKLVRRVKFLYIDIYFQKATETQYSTLHYCISIPEDILYIQ